MIHIIKNYIWVITTSLLCIVFGLLTFFTFTNQSFTTLNNSNLQLLLIIDSILLLAFLGLIIFEVFKAIKNKKEKVVGSEVNIKCILN